jgi:phosphatidylinositol alpha 1,6-mannosyltransferase
MRTLAFLVTGFPPDVSGVSHINWERAHWFAQNGYRVVVFAPDWGSECSEQSGNLTIERYPSKPWLPYPLTYVPKLSAAKWISDRLSLHQPDLIVVTDVERFFLLGCWQLPGVKYAAAKGILYTAEYHTDLYNFSAAYPGWQWLRNAAHRLKMAKLLYRNINVTVCTSAAATESCHQLGINRTQTIPFYGIPVSEYSPKWSDRTFLNQWLSPEEKNHQVILFLGRLAFEKRVDLLIDAFKLLKQTHPNCSLILAGDGPTEAMKSFRRRAANVPHVHFTGFLLGETKAKLLASCDLFCSPSPYETFGRTIVEAMASGIPVLTVDSGAVSEYVRDRQNGYLVQPDHPAALAGAIAQVLPLDHQDVIQTALGTAADYSLEKGLRRLEQYYCTLLENAGSLPATPHALAN